MRTLEVLALALCAQAGQEPLERLNAAFAAGRYEEALVLAQALADPTLAAEWTSYLHAQAGDLPGALRAARTGLAAAPEHAGLLTQALNAALPLGLAQAAEPLASTLQRVGSDADRERIAALVGHALELARRERLAERCVARSRWVVGLGLLGSALAFAFLVRSGRQ